MGGNIRSYTQEYKNTIVYLFDNGKTYAEISSEYAVLKTTIRQWVNNWDFSAETINRKWLTDITYLYTK